ncbi:MULTISPECIES: Cu(I)-responsive transcriptional regulator [Proteus]|uniref:Cu(I)-responsive transcriptional regulator n=1 Tax=Proteus TaxID=583 RepID=UPI00159958FF|nr:MULTISPECIES: Cu(I)-responsive transcriptional regulator [Proteus]QKJ48837.1 Cu(I)-responsive transcriptional regulator [Proteus vulgaris]GLX63500.1 heavy metal-dependent transcription regulator 2 [Proteus vulgaris]
MNIGQAAKKSGISSKMIRYYEQIGLIPKANRTESGYRDYSDADVACFRFIRHARALGFSTEQISTLLVLWNNGDRASADVKAIAISHIKELNRKIAELQRMTQTLEHLAKDCQGDNSPDCPIIAGLIEPKSGSENKTTKSHISHLRSSI